MAAVAFVRNHGAEFVKAAGTTDTYATTALVAAGNTLFAVCVHDNAAAANTPIVSSISRPAGENATWVLLLRNTYGSAATAGAFASGEVWMIKTTVDWPSATSLTFTYSASITMKLQNIVEFSGVEATQKGNVGNIYSTTTTAASSSTTGTQPAIGDLALGFAFASNSQGPLGGDTDTSGGSWSSAIQMASSSGNVATNNAGVFQYKILTAPNHQTYNISSGATAGNGSSVAILPFTPDPVISQAAYRFYKDGPESPPATLADQYDETNYVSSEGAVATGAYDPYGQSFLGNGQALAQASFYLRQTGTPTGNTYARLYAHEGTFGAGGKGIGSPLAESLPRTTASLGTVSAWASFDFDGTYVLESGTPYVLAVYTDSPGTVNVFSAMDNTTPTHAGNATYFYAGTWYAHTYDMIFKVYTRATGSTDTLAAQDTPATALLTTGDVNLGLRVRLQETNVGNVPFTDDWRLRYEKNASGVWTDVAIPTGAEILAASYEGGVNTTGGGTYPTVGESFMGTGAYLTAMNFQLAVENVANTTIRAHLYAHTGTFGSGGTITGPPLASSTNTISDTTLPDRVTVGYAWQTFTFDGSFVMQEGVPYCAVFTAANPISNGIFSQSSSGSSAYPGNYVRTLASGVSDSLGVDHNFRVYGIPALPVVPYASPSLNALVDSYPESNQSGLVGIPVSGALAQAFLGNGGKLSTVGFRIAKGVGSTPTGTVTVGLYAHTGTFGTGTPTGTALATSTTVIDPLTLAQPPITAFTYFDFDKSVTLSAGTAYFVALQTTNTVNGGVTAANDGTSSTHPGSYAQQSGGTWTVFPAQDLIFEVYTAADGAPTTNRLTGGTGTFTPGEVSTTGLVTNLGWSKANFTEVLYALTLKAANLADADTLRFRVLRNGVAVDTLAVTPTITASKVTGAPAYTASPALSGTGTLGATLLPKVTAAPALSGSGTLSAAVTPRPTEAPALSGDGTLSASGVVTESYATTAALSGSGSLAAATTPKPTAAASLSGTGTLTTTTTPSPAVAPALTGAGTLSAVVTPRPTGLAALTGAGSLTTASLAALAGTATLSGSGTLTANGSAAQSSTAAPTLSGSGTLSATTTPKTTATPALSGAGTLTAVVAPSIAGAAALSGSGGLTAGTTPGVVSVVALTGAGALSVVSAPALPITPALSGTGTLAASGSASQAGTAAPALSGGGTLSTATAVTTSGVAALSGAGTLVCSVTPRPTTPATLSGAGTLAAAAAPKLVAAATLSGSGTLATTSVIAGAASISLSGSGTLVAAATPKPALAAALSGAGILNASVSLATAASVNLNGTGTLVAVGATSGGTGASLSGAGTLASGAVPSSGQSATLNGAGVLGVGTTPRLASAPALTGAGTLSVAATPKATAAPALSGSGTLAATGATSGTVPVALSGTGTLSASAVPKPVGTAALNGTGTLAATGLPRLPVAVALSGSGVLTVGGTQNASSTATLSGAGTLAVVRAPGFAATPSLTGSGTLTAGLIPRPTAIAVLTGLGTLTVVGVAIERQYPALSGLGTLTATAATSSRTAPLLSGLGTLTALGFAGLAGEPAVDPGVDVAGSSHHVVVTSGGGAVAVHPEHRKTVTAQPYAGSVRVHPHGGTVVVEDR